jgi:hypothetical protein
VHGATPHHRYLSVSFVEFVSEMQGGLSNGSAGNIGASECVSPKVASDDYDIDDILSMSIDTGDTGLGGSESSSSSIVPPKENMAKQVDAASAPSAVQKSVWHERKSDIYNLLLSALVACVPSFAIPHATMGGVGPPFVVSTSRRLSLEAQVSSSRRRASPELLMFVRGCTSALTRTCS